MQLPLAAVTVALHAIAPPSTTNVVTASPSCGAAWISVSSEALHWTRIDATQAVVTAGKEIVARLESSDGRIRMQPRELASGSLPDTRVEAVQDPDRLSIEARIQIDSSCLLYVRGLFQSDQNPRLADQAAAWLLVGSASKAEKEDNAEQASRLATRALELVQPSTVLEFPQKLEFAATAVEKLLLAGHRDKAVELLSIGTETALHHLPLDHPSRLRFELARARALSFLDRNEEALNLRLGLQPRLLAIFGTASDESLSNRIRIANLRLELGDYQRAYPDLQSLRRSIERYRSPGHALRISTIRALANALTLLDLEKDSVELLAQLRSELVIAYGENDRRVIDVEEQIARNQIRLEQFEIALQGTSRIFLWRMQHLGFADVRTLKSAWMLALLYKEFGRYDTARALIDALLEESKRAAATVPRQLVLQSLAILGSVEGAQGNIDAAQEMLGSTWQQYAAIVGEDSDDTARALMLYAVLLVQSGRIDRVCPVIRETFSESRISQRPDRELRAFAKILTALCLLTDSAPRGALQDGLARLESAWRDLENRDGAASSGAMYALSTFAWANYRLGNRQIAKRLLQELVRRAEQSRQEAPARSFTRDYWFSKWITDHSQNLGYRTLALLHAQDGELDEAVRVSELARDRRLRDRFFERDGLLEKGLPVQTRDELRRQTSELSQLDAQLALETNVVERVRLESQRVLASDARNDFIKVVQQRYHVEASRIDPPSLALLRRLPDANTAIVSIQSAADRWWAIVITRGAAVRFLTLDREPDLTIAVRAWVGLLQGLPIRVWPAADNRLIQSYERPILATGRYLTVEGIAERVARALLAPLVEAAPRAHRLVIIADDDLNAVPFAALPINGTAAVNRFEIIYAPSMGTYAAMCGADNGRSWSRDLLSFAVDDLTEVKWTTNDAVDPRSPGAAIRSVFDYASRHPLPYASKEGEVASRNFAAARTTVIRGSEASKAALADASRDGSLAQYRYVHIAAHAFSFPNDPERSMLLLNGPATIDPAARVLTAAELANLQMGSELLVLAACRTAVGRYEPGQGLLGFAFAALAAGNRATVLSLWEVADDLTQRFMALFFERLKQGMRPSIALAATQREFAQNPDPRMHNPSTWAAFVLYGRS
jgi:CHAT domain-containing protein